MVELTAKVYHQIRSFYNYDRAKLDKEVNDFLRDVLSLDYKEIRPGVHCHASFIDLKSNMADGITQIIVIIRSNFTLDDNTINELLRMPKMVTFQEGIHNSIRNHTSDKFV